MGEESSGAEIQRSGSASAAAAAYDYESDPRWADYWARAVVPPHLANHPQILAQFKHNFYHRFVDPDFAIDGMSSDNSSQPLISSGGPSTLASENARSPESAERPTSRTSSRRRVALELDRRSVHFSVNAWVLIVAMVGILPIVPSHLQKKGYRLSLFGTFCSSVYSLYILHGTPRMSNVYAIQAWFQTVAGTKDFIHIMRYLEQTCSWVEANTTRLNFLSANTEILLGFLLIISLFSSHRNYTQTFMYWQLLKLMYHCPLTAPYHQAIWVKIGRLLNPYMKYAPFLHRPLFAAMRWWFR